MGLLVAGFGSDNEHAELWRIDISKSKSSGPILMFPDAECGWTVGGQTDTITRLVAGVDSRTQQVLVTGLGIDKNQAAQAVQVMSDRLQLPVVQDPMPFQDALDLGEFLVDATIKMTRFLPMPPTVGGPIELLESPSTRASSG